MSVWIERTLTHVDFKKKDDNSDIANTIKKENFITEKQLSTDEIIKTTVEVRKCVEQHHKGGGGAELISKKDILYNTQGDFIKISEWVHSDEKILFVLGPMGCGKRTMIRRACVGFNLIELSRDFAGDVDSFLERTETGSYDYTIVKGKCIKRTTLFLIDGYDTMSSRKIVELISRDKIRLIFTASSGVPKHVRDMKDKKDVKFIEISFVSRKKLEEVARLYGIIPFQTFRLLELYKEWLHSMPLSKQFSLYGWVSEDSVVDNGNIFEKGKDLMRGYADPTMAIQVYESDTRLRHMLIKTENIDYFRFGDVARQLHFVKQAEVMECYVSPNNVIIRKKLTYPRVYDGIRTIKTMLENIDWELEIEDPVRRLITYCIEKNKACITTKPTYLKRGRAAAKKETSKKSMSGFTLNPPVTI